MSLRATGLLAQLGAATPLVAAPMAGGPSRPELVIAASRAGGLGFLAGGYQSAAQLHSQISAVQSETSVFGVNLFVPNPVPVSGQDFARYRSALQRWITQYAGRAYDDAEAASIRERLAEVVLPGDARADDDGWNEKLALLEREPVPVVSLTFGLPAEQDVRRLQATGAKVMVTVTDASEAARAQAAGADGLIVQSGAAGGHHGSWNPVREPQRVSLRELLGNVRVRTELPLWAAGGLSTPEAVHAVLVQGAEAAAVGTVLLRSGESGAHEAHKQALAQASAERSTVVTTAFSGRPARALPNAFTGDLTAQAPLGFPALHHLTSPLRRAFAEVGDPEGINLWAGTGFTETREESAEVILRRLAGQ
ncbi:nitronate monooxygenase family protein [Nesterenkonia sp. Act20]|uniref:NAD(P)H-dependent flavin oxidoreductase n=1 Tax=Nesterenkonia sp. Act20 TaxID=1483432 RepID=UPI0021004825|nr:nitronate monooxygenase [Nesterenkonia sp. Act20]